MLDTQIVKAILNSIIALMMTMFLVNNLNLKCKKIFAIIIVFVIIYVPSIILNMFFSENNIIFRILLSVISMFIGMKLVSTNKTKKYIRNIYIAYIITFILEMIGQGYFDLVMNVTNYENKDIYGDNVITILTMAIMGLASIIVIMSYLLLKKKIKGKIKYQILSILILIPLFNMVLLTLLYIYNFENMKNTLELYSIFCLIISFIVNVTIYEIILNLEKYYQQEKQLVFLKEKEEMLYEYYKLATTNKEDLRKLKHDMKNELQIAYSFFESDSKKEKAKNMLDEMKDNIDKIGKIEYCENTILNALLGIKVSQAQEKGIEFEVHIKEGIAINIEDIDTCNIFSNLIDNSIQGTEKAIEKKINLIIEAQMGFVVIKIENTYNDEIKLNDKKELLTNKQDSESHGYGIKIVKSIVEKYKGDIQIDYTDSLFKVIILIPSEQKGSE